LTKDPQNKEAFNNALRRLKYVFQFLILLTATSVLIIYTFFGGNVPSFKTLLTALIIPLVAFGPIMTVHFFSTLKNEAKDNPPLTRIAVFLWFPVLYWHSLERWDGPSFVWIFMGPFSGAMEITNTYIMCIRSDC
tara:strand:+ start:196 stop:600 length:405 start_codon:yes stop_codon:yes gene_type:complete